jgi:hypothetical protein
VDHPRFLAIEIKLELLPQEGGNLLLQMLSQRLWTYDTNRDIVGVTQKLHSRVGRVVVVKNRRL